MNQSDSESGRVTIQQSGWKSDQKDGLLAGSGLPLNDYRLPGLRTRLHGETYLGTLNYETGAMTAFSACWDPDCLPVPIRIAL